MLGRKFLAFFSLFLSTRAAQPSAPQPIPAPLRNLTWGQLNFLHTTDIHGWFAGHLQEPSYSADWGDYISFTTRMRERAEADGRDLLVVDTGDRIEGNGLYDGSEPKGRYTADILREQQVDLLTCGNHELYKQNSSEDEYLITVPNFKDAYLSSNIDIIDPKTGDLVPLSRRFKKFSTRKQGIRIMAFGFLFDFRDNYNNTVVRPVKETVGEQWFQEAIRDKEVDLFVVIGHVPVQSVEYDIIFKAIRSVRWDTPIQFFGGHYHIRDYVKYDSKAHGLASGRFMETIGFMSIDGLTGGSLSFSRKYIDNNLFSFHHHTELNETTFPTAEGKAVSEKIAKARHALKLDDTFGCVPEDLWMSRAEYSSKDSIYTWLEQHVLPESIGNNSLSAEAGLVVINTGAIRFDIFKGPFTRDTSFIVSPFGGGFRYTKDVPYDKALKIADVINKQPQILYQDSSTNLRLPTFLAPPEQMAISHDIISDKQTLHISSRDQIPLPAVTLSNPPLELTPGYTTQDDGGSDGDDTLHSPISFYRLPNVIQAFIPARSSSPSVEVQLDSAPETVDLIYLDFIEPWIELAAKFVGLDFDIDKDARAFMPGSSLTSLMVEWVERNWKCEDAV